MDYPDRIDFTWLVRGRGGRLAAMITAGDGPIPATTLAGMNDATDIEAMLLDLPPVAAATMHVTVPRPDSFIDLCERGLYVYDAGHGYGTAARAADTYHLVASPSVLLTMDQLPASLRAMATFGGNRRRHRRDLFERALGPRGKRSVSGTQYKTTRHPGAGARDRIAPRVPRALPGLRPA